MNGSFALHINLFALFAHLCCFNLFAHLCCFTIARWFCAAAIKSKWVLFGLTKTTEDVESVVAALNGKG